MAGRIVAIGLVLSALAGQACAQAIPLGTYFVTGFAGGSCPHLNGMFVGTLNYPGPGQLGTQFIFQSQAAGSGTLVYKFVAFPPVPAEGLNGWGASSPVTPHVFEYQNGNGVRGESEPMSFQFTQISKTVAQGSWYFQMRHPKCTGAATMAIFLDGPVY